ncbi:TniQ family protein, partial [uncultured Roseobacter sp.]|uniref:TniQ family protein n=1 Tax=uncultured Roseobacter sp. TaxID=114847 RepID=UPI002613BBB1
MVRVAARYGLEVPDMTTWLAGQGTGMQSHRLIDDIAPDPDLLWLWAWACRIDPARLTRLSLAFRYRKRTHFWTLDRSEAPVCLACLDEDRARGHDSYLRSAWRLAEHLVCPAHQLMLHDRCPACSAQLRVSFQFRNGLLRPFCSRCGGLLTSRGAEPDHNLDAGFAEGILDLQRQIRRILQRHDERRVRLEHAIRTLWAPLDRVDAARPVLALWFDQPGWRCPFEARAAVSKEAPFQHLPLRWRALTLIILGDLFGAAL